MEQAGPQHMNKELEQASAGQGPQQSASAGARPCLTTALHALCASRVQVGNQVRLYGSPCPGGPAARLPRP